MWLQIKVQKTYPATFLRSILVEESKVAAKEENQAKTLLRVELEMFQLSETKEKTNIRMKISMEWGSE